jgi:hypothetical protein
MVALRPLHRSAFVAVLAIACGGSPPSDAGIDAGIRDAGFDAGPRAPDVCDELGLARTTFVASDGDGFGDIAGDFSVHTTSGGTWNLASEWSGCESYVFFVHFPGANDELFQTLPDLVWREGRENARYFFVSDAEGADARATFAADVTANVEAGLAFLEPAEQSFWRARIHYATDRATDIDGTVGAMLRAYLAWARTPEAVVDLGERGPASAPLPAVFGIDRAQRWDPGDNLAPFVGGEPALGMAAFLSHFYEYRAALDARLAGESGVTVVSIVDERTTARTFVREVMLPEDTSAFDTLEVDVEITCDERNPFACSEWDRIANVQLCADGTACTQKFEIARWITPYWRRGRQRYAMDASPMLGLMRAGGAATFYVELGPPWERATEWIARVSLRLSSRGGPSAAGAERAFTGGVFDASYNVREPFTFTPPADATRVELVTILSGHGQTEGDDCAEWCDHRHLFSVNGTALPDMRFEGDIGAERGCAAHAADGVIPGQWGNWAQSRAYWCPGMVVAPMRTDITSLVTLGAPNELDYEGRLGASEPRGGDIALSAYVVWYR